MYSTIKSKSNDMNKHLITCILLVPLVCSCGKQATTSVDTREPLLLNDSLQEIITLDTVRDTPLTNELLLNGRAGLGKTLEVGTGCGYQAAVLAQLSPEVYSVERLAPLLSGLMADDGVIYVEAEHALSGCGEWQTVRSGRAGQVFYHLMRSGKSDGA